MRTRVDLLRSRGEDGFAMVLVIGTMAVLSLVAIAALAVVANGIKPSRHTRDYQAALAAAQAGLDDYVTRLNGCDTYWRQPCGSSTTDSALVQSASGSFWQQVPATSGTDTPAYYQYAVVTTPANGLLRVRVTGRVNKTMRTITADLRKDRLLGLIYYTDYETTAPALYPMVSPAGQVYGYADANNRVVYQIAVSAASAAVCEKHYYDGRGSITIGTRNLIWQNKQNGAWVNGSTYGTVTDTCSTISFRSGDRLAGKIHTNDSVSLTGAASFVSQRAGDVFGSSWDAATATVKPPVAGKLYFDGTADPASCTGCMAPIYEAPMTLPPDNREIASYADKTANGEGCLYTGPTQLTFKPDGSVDVRSPASTDASVLNTACGSAATFGTGATQNVRPANGVIYVRGISSGGCSSTDLGFKLTEAETCLDGNAFVSGTVAGRFTVGASNDINIVGNTVYSTGTSSTSVDSLGLIANGFVQVYHPVTADGNGGYTDDAGGRFTLPAGGSGIEIDAALLSVKASITVQNYTRGSPLGTLRIIGTLAQKFRGPVSLNGATGYIKDYIYDARLLTQPPPFFLDPDSAKWKVGSIGEQGNPASASNTPAP